MYVWRGVALVRVIRSPLLLLTSLAQPKSVKAGGSRE
jgi:hypothetical protein